MKKRINYLLSTVRKFGFIMAAIMIFPYVTAIPAVMASEGEASTSIDEISMEELEEVYQQSNEELLYDIDVYNEVNQYVVRQSDGTLSLEIPFNAEITISESKLEEIKADIEAINVMILDGEAFTDEDNEIYITGLDEDFQIQNAVNKFYIKYWKINLLLSEPAGFILTFMLFALSVGSSYALLSGGPSAVANLFVSSTTATSFGITATLLSGTTLGLAGEPDAATFIYALCVSVMAGQAIATILSSAAPGVGNIIVLVLKTLLAIGANYVWGRIGSDLLNYTYHSYRNRELDGDYNRNLVGTKMKSSLTLRNIKWSFQYN